MPRKYKRKNIEWGGGRRWSAADLEKAIENINRTNMSVLRASRLFNIPRSTLTLKLKGWQGKTPRQSTMEVENKKTALSENQEAHLVKMLKIMNKWGIGLSKEEVKNVVADYVGKNSIQTPFKNNRPGDDWWQGFKTRHRLSLKKPERVEGARARQADDPFIMNDFYEKLELILEEKQLTDKPQNIWNCDETGFCSDPGSTRVVCEKGVPAKRITGGSGRNMTTVLACVNAAGQCLPPAIIHQGKRMWDSMIGGEEAYPNTAYFTTDNGWMTGVAFLSWFQKCFLKNVSEYPCLLIYDGHVSHISIELVELAMANDVVILKLPPHTSHILQPLDVAVFRGLKSKWDSTLTEWARSHLGQKVSKSTFADLIGKAWKTLKPETIIKGFKKCGIYDPAIPGVNRKAIDESTYHPEKLQRYKKHGESSRDNKNQNDEFPPTTVNSRSSTTVEDTETQDKPSSSSSPNLTDKKETPGKTFESILLKVARPTQSAIKRVKKKNKHI